MDHRLSVPPFEEHLSRPVNSIPTDLFVAKQAEDVVFVSCDPISADGFDEHSWRNLQHQIVVEPERRDLPVLMAEIVMWEGDDGDSATPHPHLHYTCPKCRQMQNVDLYDTDTNPRLVCCDICRWDSFVWLAWDSSAVGRPQP